jgi:isochorismate pyruvate lyase
MKAPAIQPESCQTMAEVRAGVDALDQELVALLARRFAFMDAAARIKPSRDAVRDEARKAQVIANATEAARAAGIPDGLIPAIWEQLVEASIAYELGVWDDRRRREAVPATPDPTTVTDVCPARGPR